MMGIFIAHWGYQTTYMLCAMIVILTLLVYRYTISKKRTKVAI
jgi:predicted MFS family arabinose efflux permease